MKTTVSTLKKQKENKEKITMLTCYDYSMAKLMDEAGIEILLIGDSLGNTMLGYDTTLPVTMEDMIQQQSAEVQKMLLCWQICHLCPIRLLSMMQL